MIETMRRLTLILFITALALAVSCKGNDTSRIISNTPVKTEILGMKLCEKSNENSIQKAVSAALGEPVLIDSQSNDQVGRVVRAIPSSLHFNYGGYPWTYVDVSLDGNDTIAQIILTASYESVEVARKQYEAVIELFTQKYGKGNTHPSNQLTFWTDDTNSVGVSYEESAAVNGSDRSFCSLYYVNIDLADALDKQNVPDI
jgi:hypothetical protein